VPFVLIASGQVWIPSSLTAILIALEPALVALLALRLDARERVDGRRTVGLVAGAAGVVALLGLDLEGGGPAVAGALMVIVAACCYAFASLQVRRRFADVRPLGLAAATVTISSLLLAAPAALTAPPAAPSPQALGALALLGLACTAAAFVLYFTLLGEVGASRATVITYVAPAVAVILGVWLLGERVGPWTVVGLALVAAGSWIATRGRLSRPARGSEEMAPG
jgi:drug/metabolite transporter (DMT)-like permease